MMKKKQQFSHKKNKTYRPKFSEVGKKHHKAGQYDDGTFLQRPHNIDQDIKMAPLKLPENFTPPGSDAYWFPSWGYVIMALALLVFLMFLFF